MPLLEIRFTKSTSKNYKEVLRYARKFPHFEEGDPSVLLFDNLKEVFSQWEEFNLLFHRVKSWSGTTIIFNTVPLTPYRKLSEWFYAVQEIKDCYNFHQAAYDKSTFCADGGDWACKKLHSIARFVNNHFCTFWYKYGHFKESRVWVIDKEDIKAVLREEAKLKGLDSCPFFSMQKVFDDVDLLPNELVIDDNYWKLVYRQEWRGSRPVEVPISVEHLNHQLYPMPEDSFFDEDPVEEKPINLTEDQMANLRIELYLREKSQK